MKQAINTTIYGMFLDIFVLICLLLTPIFMVYGFIKLMRKTKKQHCIVCKKKKRRIDDDGICHQCNTSLDELFDSINGEPDTSEAQDGQIPWMSIEVVPAGMPEKEMANIDIRIDSDTGMLYTVKNGIYREIGSDM